MQAHLTRLFKTSKTAAFVGALALAWGLIPQVQAAKGGNNATTLAGYKTIDICAVDDATWRYSGEIAVWNEGALDTIGLNITDFIEFKTGKKWEKAFDMPVMPYPFGEIAAGTTKETATTFRYSLEGTALPGTIRNNASITILNHSNFVGKAFGPNPKVTYAGGAPAPCPTDSGCTLTQGYWGTHSAYGPAGYDAMWASVGEDTPFFLAGTTWYEAITTVPKGNGYWLLANQYVAAILNQNAGAWVPDGVQDTLDLATAWFSNKAPGDCPKGSDCGLQKTWAGVLDDYNNGCYEGGPPHCGLTPEQNAAACAARP